MKDVAALAGVSVPTVSNVVNERIREMSPETRSRVLDAVEKLHYVPNLSARSLRSRRQRVLGFLVIDEGPKYLADPMTDQILAGVGDVARDHDYGVLVRASHPGPDGRTLLAPLWQGRVDAACLLLSGDARSRWHLALTAAERGFPVAVFESGPDAVNSVRADNEGGARQLVEHLVSRGHERIAFLSTATSWPMLEERIAGYRDALESACIAYRPELVLSQGQWTPASGAEMTKQLLQLPLPPTAIIGGNDLLALGAQFAIQQSGRSVPDDIAVAGFNDFLFAAHLSPSLTTVAVDGYELGRRAAELLVGQLASGGPPTDERIAVELRPRLST